MNEWVQETPVYEVVRRCECGREWSVYAKDPGDVSLSADRCCTFSWSGPIKHRLANNVPDSVITRLYVGREKEVLIENEEATV